MRYVVLFLGVAAANLACAAALGGWAWALAWPALSLVVVSWAYARRDPRWFGKRPGGTLAWWAWLALGPYIVVAGTLFHALRFLRREPAWRQLSPTLYIGRRLLPGEMPPGVTLVVDLTCELPEPAGVRAGREYWCFPILDASVPPAAALVAWARRVAEHPGVAYAHCAAGRGRTGLFAVCWWMLTRGERDARAALAAVKAARPEIRLAAAQRRLLPELERLLAAEAPSPGDAPASASDRRDG